MSKNKGLTALNKWDFQKKKKKKVIFIQFNLPITAMFIS